MPLLGEPFAVELANSDHRSGREEWDFLAHPTAARPGSRTRRPPPTWWSRAPLPAVAAAVRDIRDATRLLLTETAPTQPPRGQRRRRALNALRAAPPATWPSTSAAAPGVAATPRGRRRDVFRAAVACALILFLAGDDAAGCGGAPARLPAAVRHPPQGPPILPRTCAHSVRQARYYRRHTSAT